MRSTPSLGRAPKTKMSKWLRTLFVFSCASVLLAQTPSPQQLFKDANAAQQRGDNKTAVKLYQQILEVQPNAVPVRANLASALANLKRFDEAIDQYRKVLAADPENLPVRM